MPSCICLVCMFLSVFTRLFLILTFGCAGSSLLCGLSLVAVQRFLIAVASPVAEHRL